VLAGSTGDLIFALNATAGFTQCDVSQVGSGACGGTADTGTNNICTVEGPTGANVNQPCGWDTWMILTPLILGFKFHDSCNVQQLEQHADNFLVNFSFDSSDLHPDEPLVHAEDPVHFHFAIDDQIAALQFFVSDEDSVIP